VPFRIPWVSQFNAYHWPPFPPLGTNRAIVAKLVYFFVVIGKEESVSKGLFTMAK
jgi:hypothetical protein